MAKFGASSYVGMLATTGDGKGVDVGTGDGPRASTWDEDGVTLVGGRDGVGATLGGLTGINIEDENGVDDGRLSQGGSSLATYRFFFAVVPFPLESCDRGQGGSTPPDDISIYKKIIL